MPVYVLSVNTVVTETVSCVSSLTQFSKATNKSVIRMLLPTILHKLLENPFAETVLGVCWLTRTVSLQLFEKTWLVWILFLAMVSDFDLSRTGDLLWGLWICWNQSVSTPWEARACQSLQSVGKRQMLFFTIKHDSVNLSFVLSSPTACGIVCYGDLIW